MIGNILIVDDDPAALKLLKDILTADRHVVRPFNNGELALRSIQAEAPELILLDIRMPGMSGFEVCQRIKASEQLKEIPVIFISAATDLEDKVQAFQEGGIDYITKPFQRDEVVARVRTHIALSHTIQRMKKVTEALRKSEESLKLAQTVAHLGHWEWDVASGRFICSEEMGRILGLTSPETMGSRDDFLRIVHPDDKGAVAARLDGMLAGDQFDADYRIILPDGSVRVVHGKGKAFCLEAGQQAKIIGIVQDCQDCGQMKVLGVAQDITEYKALQEKLEEQANTDSLTGCNNRRHFLERAEQEFQRVHRYGGKLSMLMLDLDHFKRINDNYGHQAGDAALKTFAKVCQGLLREVDVMGRLGGEEFAILLPETAAEQALEVAGRLCQKVAATGVPRDDAPPLHITTSIGAASLTPGDTRIDTLLNRADKALYQAKETGRNRACCAQ